MVRYALALAWPMCMAFPLMSQSPAIEWQRCVGGNNFDVAQDVHQTSDGGYIATGISRSADQDMSGAHGDQDGWIAKLDAAGATQWTTVVGGSAEDVLMAVKEADDGGYMAAGHTWSNDGDVVGQHGASDAWVVKLDATGALQWQLPLGITTYAERATDILPTVGDGFVLCGRDGAPYGDTLSNIVVGWLIEVDGAGTVLWQEDFTDSQPNRVQRTSDNGYALFGLTGNEAVPGYINNGDMWLAKLNATGAMEWQFAYGGQSYDEAQDGQPTNDGGYVLGGGSWSGDIPGHHGWSLEDLLLVKVDAAGALEWMKPLGASNDDFGYCVLQASDGGFIGAGEAGSAGGDIPPFLGGVSGFWLAKLDASGTLQWSGVYGGSGLDAPRGLATTADGGFVACGVAGSNDGDVSGNHGGTGDAWIVKFGDDATGLAPTAGSEFSLFMDHTARLLRLSSSSAVSDATITVTDALGRKLSRIRMTGTVLTVDVSSWSPGTYFATWHTAGQEISVPVLVQ